MELKNKEGYADPTASKAINNVEREQKKMSYVNYGETAYILPGEIWKIDKKGKKEEIVVLAVQDEVVISTRLYPSKERESLPGWKVELLNDRVVMEGVTGYTYKNRMCERVGTLTKDEFNYIKECLINELKLRDIAEQELKNRMKEKEKESREDIGENKEDIESAYIKYIEENMEKLEKENSELKNKVKANESGLDKIAAELIRAKSQLDVYKELFQQLFKKINCNS